MIDASIDDICLLNNGMIVIFNNGSGYTFIATYWE